jgi:hypothetical protein
LFKCHIDVIDLECRFSEEPFLSHAQYRGKQKGNKCHENEEYYKEFKQGEPVAFTCFDHGDL